MSAASRSAPRWVAVDQTRGVAMVLVWLSHFGTVYFRTAPAAVPARLIAISTRVASPVFVTMSGVLVGWLAARARRPERVRARLLDRALFLLLVAHPLIWAAHIAYASGPRAALRVEFITDTLGVCLLAAPFVVFVVGPRLRLAAAAAAFAGCWVAIACCRAEPPGAAMELLVGSLAPAHFDYVFPVVPWLCVFVAATVLGETLHRRRSGEVARIAWRTSAGLAAVGLAGLAAHGLATGDPVLWAMTALKQKSPPGPVYVALYGGAAVALFAAFVELERRRHDGALARTLALVGRNSLFAFVAQYVVYYTALALLRPAPSRAWTLWLAGSIAILLAAVAAWEALDGNRWLSVGIARAVAPAAGTPGAPERVGDGGAGSAA